MRTRMALPDLASYASTPLLRLRSQSPASMPISTFCVWQAGFNSVAFVHYVCVFVFAFESLNVPDSTVGKTEVTAVKYDLRSEKPKIYVLPPESEESKAVSATRPSEPNHPRPYYNRRQP